MGFGLISESGAQASAFIRLSAEGGEGGRKRKGLKPSFQGRGANCFDCCQGTVKSSHWEEAQNETAIKPHD